MREVVTVKLNQDLRSSICKQYSTSVFWDIQGNLIRYTDTLHIIQEEAICTTVGN